jgi:hypothetical protein
MTPAERTQASNGRNSRAEDGSKPLVVDLEIEVGGIVLFLVAASPCQRKAQPQCLAGT